MRFRQCCQVAFLECEALRHRRLSVSSYWKSNPAGFMSSAAAFAWLWQFTGLT